MELMIPDCVVYAERRSAFESRRYRADPTSHFAARAHPIARRRCRHANYIRGPPSKRTRHRQGFPQVSRPCRKSRPPRLTRREWDMLESGTRELTGEWVVGTDVWKRLKTDRRAKRENRRNSRRQDSRPTEMALNGLGAVRGMLGGRDSPDIETDNESVLGKKGGAEKVIYYIHGGAYYVGNAATHRLVTIGVSKACNARVFGELVTGFSQRELIVKPLPTGWHRRTCSHYPSTTCFMGISDC